MAIAITIPRLGWSMEEGVFVGWLKREGEPVRVGDPIFSLEGEKATQDVESVDEGTLRIPPDAPSPGQTVLVGTIIGYLLQADESELPATTPAGPGEVRQSAPVEAAPARVEAAGQRSAKPRSSPLARRIAREHGIDWTQLVGSGSSGRIRRDDVLEAVRNGQAASRPAPATTAVGHENGNGAPSRSFFVDATRNTIAGRMVESLRTTAPVTLTTTVDATNLVGLRRQFKAAWPAGDEIPSYNDFLIKLCALALRDHPRLNARWRPGDAQIVVADEAHIGFAVDTEGGLLVPVIKGPADLGIRAIASRSRELVAQARGGKLRPVDMQGGTFTITNLGAFGIETFTPIINIPECAILGVGKIECRPVMDGEKVVGREQMFLSLTFDHRIVDGAPAARFLQHLGRLIENPGPWLMS